MIKKHTSGELEPLSRHTHFLQSLNITSPSALGAPEFPVVLVPPVISKSSINQITFNTNTGIKPLQNESFGGESASFHTWQP